MATPLLHSLVESLGPEVVDVVVTRRTAPLLQGFPGLGAVIGHPGCLRWRRPRSVVSYLRLVRQLRRQRYDAILDASRLLQSAWLAFLGRPSRSIGLRLPRTLGPYAIRGLDYLYTDEVDIPIDLHMIRQNLALLRPLQIPPAGQTMQVFPAAQHRRAAERWLAARGLGADRPYAAIHPGAKWPPKRWPAARFREIARRLQEDGIAVILLGDRDDRDLLASVASGLAPAPLVAAGELDLLAAACLIQGARVFLGNDSGLGHLAVAVGTPAVVLFGPTLPERTGPLSPPHRAVAQPVACRPCRLYVSPDHCEQGHNVCMDAIRVDGVWDVVRSVLEHDAPRRRA